MINQINDSIANVVANKRDFITSKTAFTRNCEWDFNLMLGSKFLEKEQQDMI